MAPSEAWRELALALKFEEPEEMAQRAAYLAPALGLDRATVGELRGANGAALVEKLRELHDHHRKECRQLRAAERLARAMSAAQTLESIDLGAERWLEIDISVIEALCAHPTAMFVSLTLDQGEPVLVDKRRLQTACRVLRRYPGLRVFLDADALHFRWHDGLGGLNLRYQYRLSCDEKQRVFPVVVGRTPSCPGLEISPPLPARRPPPAWLGDVLSDLGLIP